VHQVKLPSKFCDVRSRPNLRPKNTSEYGLPAHAPLLG